MWNHKQAQPPLLQKIKFRKQTKPVLWLTRSWPKQLEYKVNPPLNAEQKMSICEDCSFNLSFEWLRFWFDSGRELQEYNIPIKSTTPTHTMQIKTANHPMPSNTFLIRISSFFTFYKLLCCKQHNYSWIFAFCERCSPIPSGAELQCPILITATSFKATGQEQM